MFQFEPAGVACLPRLLLRSGIRWHRCTQFSRILSLQSDRMNPTRCAVMLPVIYDYRFRCLNEGVAVDRTSHESCTNHAVSTVGRQPR